MGDVVLSDKPVVVAWLGSFFRLPRIWAAMIGKRAERRRCRRRISSVAVWALAAALTIACGMSNAQEFPSYSALLDGNVPPDVEVQMLAHSERLFPVNVIYRKEPVRPLAKSSRVLTNVHFQSSGKDYDLYDYLATNRVAGLLVLKDGAVVLEDYELGFDAGSHWNSFSMAKSITSTLIGAALHAGLIKSLDEPVTRYVPQLRGGAYDGVSVRNILQMSSGVRWNEKYTDPNSDEQQIARLRSERRPGAILAYMKGLPRAAPAGTVWNYNTGETFVLGAILQGAVHQTLATYLSDTIWAKLGMEQDATWWLEAPGGLEYAGAGINATLRDFGRFGLLALNDGIVDGQRVVPEGWFSEAASPHRIGDKTVPYGYQWWASESQDPLRVGSFAASGIFGQAIYINPREKVVIVVLSAQPKPDESMLNDGAFFLEVVRALH